MKCLTTFLTATALVAALAGTGVAFAQMEIGSGLDLRLGAAAGPAETLPTAGKKSEVINPDAAKRLDDEELVQKLTGENAGPDSPAKMLKEVVDRMGTVARFLNAENPGADTQENERRIVARFDALIHMAQQQQPNTSPNPGPPNPSDSRRPNPSQQPSNGEGRTNAATKEMMRHGSATPTALSGADLAGKYGWGNLPPKAREAVLNGIQERFVPTYEALIAKYYQDLSDLGKSSRTNH